MRYGGSQQSPEKFIIFHAPTKNDRSHGRFLLSSRAYFDADFNSSSVICFSTNNQQIIIRTLPKLKKAHIIIKNRECVACFSFDQPIAASDNRLSYACILLFPTGTKVSRGVPDFPLAMTKYFVPNEIWTPHCNDIKYFVPNEIR